MSGMDKMWASFIAIGLMAAASLVVSFARSKLRRGVLRVLVMLAAFVLLFYAVIFMIASIA